jgi:hypothetical protein
LAGVLACQLLGLDPPDLPVSGKASPRHAKLRKPVKIIVRLVTKCGEECGCEQVER